MNQGRAWAREEERSPAAVERGDAASTRTQGPGVRGSLEPGAALGKYRSEQLHFPLALSKHLSFHF